MKVVIRRPSALGSCLLTLALWSVFATHPVWGQARVEALENFATSASLAELTPTTAGVYFLALRPFPGGASLNRWQPEMAAPEMVEPQISGTSFRVRGDRIVYLKGSGASSRIVLRPPSGPAEEFPTPGFTPLAIRFAYPDGDSFLLQTRPHGQETSSSSELLVYSARKQRVSRLPVPPACERPSLYAVAGPAQAVLACDDRLFLSLFAGPVQQSRDLKQDASTYWPLEPSVRYDTPADVYAGPILALGKRGATGPFHILALGPPNLKLPPAKEIVFLFHRPDEGILLVQQQDAKKRFRMWAYRTASGRSSRFASAAPMTGQPVHWSARRILVWREGAYLVLFDTEHLAPLIRAQIGQDISPLPGTMLGNRMLLVSARDGAFDLFWLRYDSATQALSVDLAASALQGIPQACFSAEEQDTCYVVVARKDGPGLDLLAISP